MPAVGKNADTVGLYGAAKATFMLTSSSHPDTIEKTFTFGRPGAGWIAIAGDWDGDGVDTAGLYDPKQSNFRLTNDPSGGKGKPEIGFRYGRAGAGWLPVAGDWDGNGKDTVGLYDPKTSKFLLINRLDATKPEIGFRYGRPGAGWLALTGDWDGDGKSGVGLYLPEDGSFYLRNALSKGNAEVEVRTGVKGKALQPLGGRWQ
jgi:hypothetical protein